MHVTKGHCLLVKRLLSRYEQYCACWGERGLRKTFFMPLLFGFPPKMTANIKPVGIDDENLNGPVFQAVLLCKTLFKKKGMIHTTVCVLTLYTFTRPWVCLLYGIQQACWGVMIWRETSCVFCLLLSVCKCQSDQSGTERSWQKHQKITGSSLQTCYVVFFLYTVHTERSHKMNRPDRHAGSIIVFV